MQKMTIPVHILRQNLKPLKKSFSQDRTTNLKNLA